MLRYDVEQRPPWPAVPFLSLQHVLTMLGATIAVPTILASAFGLDGPDTATFISNVLLAMGTATLIQSVLGSRLPIVQGSSFAFLPAFIYIAGYYNGYEGLQYAAGAVILGGALQFFLGISQLAGALQKFLTPVVVGPTIFVIGLSLFSVGGQQASTSWPMAILTIVLIFVIGFFLRPKSEKGLSFNISTFPVVAAISIVWVISLILTLSGFFPGDSAARVDLSTAFSGGIFKDMNSFFLPWGMPKFDPAFTVIFIIAYLVSTVESIGDYNAINEIARRKPDPLSTSAVNRGISAEGASSLLGALLGANPTTSYSENIGVVGITGVGSRFVVAGAGVILLIAGFFPAVGGLLATIPAPIMGGLYCVLFGMIAGIGLRYTAKADLNDMRNVSIIGFAIFFGFAVPAAFGEAGAQSVLRDALGAIPADMLLGIFTSNMAVTALTALVFDKALPSRREASAATESDRRSDR